MFMVNPIAPKQCRKQDAEASFNVSSPIVIERDGVLVSDQQKTVLPADGYKVHKLSKQVWYRFFIGISGGYQTFRQYQSNTEFYHNDPAQGIFQNEPFVSIYDPSTSRTKILRQMLLPKKFRKDRLSEAEQSTLRDNWKRIGKTASWFGIVAIAGRFLGNATMLYGCTDEDSACRSGEVGVALLDEGVVLTWAISLWYNAKGSSPRLLEQNSFPLFNRSAQFLFAANVVQVGMGGLKVWVEVDHYFEDPKTMNTSAFIDGAAEMGRGAANTVYGAYLIRQASQAAHFGSYKMANNILAASSRSIPSALLYSMRVVGMSGPAISLVKSSYTVYEGVTGSDSDEAYRKHQIISGALGAASSAMFLAGAYFVTPASLPVGIAMFCIGGLLLVAETLYDEWDSPSQSNRVPVDTQKW